MMACSSSSTGPFANVPELDCATLLKEAKYALHLLMTNRSLVRVRFADDREVEYRKQDIGELRKYIRELESECNGGRGRPARGVFPCGSKAH